MPKTLTMLISIMKCKWTAKCTLCPADGQLVAGVMSREIQVMSVSSTTPIEWTTLVFILLRENASHLKNRTNPSTKLKTNQPLQLKSVYPTRRVMATALSIKGKYPYVILITRDRKQSFSTGRKILIRNLNCAYIGCSAQFIFTFFCLFVLIKFYFS